MQKTRSRMIGFALTGVAALLFILVRQDSLQATFRLQSPLPPVTCFEETLDGLTLEVVGYVTDGEGATAITYRVANANKKDISYVAFGLGDWTPVAPADDTTVSDSLGDYHVAWTNRHGAPGFASIKYESEFDGFSQGAADTFMVTVADFDPAASTQVQMKAGRDRTAFQVTLDGAGCDRMPPPFSPLPTPTPTPEGYNTLPTEPIVPPCVFAPPPGGIPDDEPVIPLDAYTFSEPRVVVTNTAPIGIQQWLPDGETLLITRESRTDPTVSVALVNTNTGEVEEIVEPRNYLSKPMWLSMNSTVVWKESGPLQDEKFNTNEPGYWVRSFDPPVERRLSDDGRSKWSTTYDVSLNGKELVFMSLPGGTQPLIWNQETKRLRSLSVDLANWRYEKGPLYPVRPFTPLWHPDGDKILFQDGTWLFLYDLTTNSGCEIDMTRFVNRYIYVRQASWSPDGRYLAINNAGYPPYMSTHGPHDLVLILDTYTGDAIQYALGNTVYRFSWAPDSQTIVVEESSRQELDGFPTAIFYLLNIHSGEQIPVLTEGTTLGAAGARVLWSPDGKALIYQCKNTAARGVTSYIDRICINQVETN